MSRLDASVLHAYHAGRLSYGAFALATEPYVMAMAKWAFGRWRTNQRLYAVEDVEQELRIGVERAARTYQFRCKACKLRFVARDGYVGHRQRRHGDGDQVRSPEPAIEKYVHYQAGVSAWEPLRREGQRRRRGETVPAPTMIELEPEEHLEPVDGLRVAEVCVALAEARSVLNEAGESILDTVLETMSHNQVGAKAIREAAAEIRQRQEEQHVR